MKIFFKRLFFAFGFLTVIPGPGKLKINDEDTGKSTIFFPIVGLFIGFLIWLITFFSFLSHFTLSVLVVVSLLFFTRGLHADGLIDTFDGFLSGKKEKDEIFKIMRDSRLGALGFLLAFSVYSLKIAFIYELISLNKNQMNTFLISMPALSRGGVAITGFIFSYARKEGGLGRSFVSSIGLKEAIISFILMIIISYRKFDLYSILLAPIILIFWVLWGFICKKKIDGITGDTIGAGIELSEIVYLIAVLLLANLS